MKFCWPLGSENFKNYSTILEDTKQGIILQEIKSYTSLGSCEKGLI